MKTMTQQERVQAAIKGEQTDRMPFSIWYHVPHVDQDPVALAEESLRLAELYDLDFIKMMPFGNYQAADFGLSCTYFCTKTEPVLERKFAIDDPIEWTELLPHSGDYANHGKQLQAAQHLKKLIGDKPLPFVQTIFSPFTTAKKLAGNRVFDDMRKHPDYLHQALKAITETCVDSCYKHLEAGVSGFFFASQCSSFDYVTEEEYLEFGKTYDMQVLAACKEAWFNIVHIHGDNTMWKLLADYPVQCVNWHDRWVEPSMQEARKLSDKCFMGGIDETKLLNMNEVEIKQHLEQAIEIHGGRKGLIIAPGCVAKITTPEEKMVLTQQILKTL